MKCLMRMTRTTHVEHHSNAKWKTFPHMFNMLYFVKVKPILSALEKQIQFIAPKLNNKKES